MSWYVGVEVILRCGECRCVIHLMRKMGGDFQMIILFHFIILFSDVMPFVVVLARCKHFYLSERMFQMYASWPFGWPKTMKCHWIYSRLVFQQFHIIFPWPEKIIRGKNLNSQLEICIILVRHRISFKNNTISNSKDSHIFHQYSTSIFQRSKGK